MVELMSHHLSIVESRHASIASSPGSRRISDAVGFRKDPDRERIALHRFRVSAESNVECGFGADQRHETVSQVRERFVPAGPDTRIIHAVVTIEFERGIRRLCGGFLEARDLSS